MRRLLALAAVATVALVSAPAADASYRCTTNSPTLDVCVQVSECPDVCFIAPGVQFQCYLGFTGERYCRIVRALSVEVGGGV